jgi:hypothetical protein
VIARRGLRLGRDLESVVRDIVKVVESDFYYQYK